MAARNRIFFKVIVPDVWIGAGMTSFSQLPELFRL
jgi:hypothetical protein